MVFLTEKCRKLILFSCVILFVLFGNQNANSITMDAMIEKKCVTDRIYREGNTALKFASKLIQERKFLDAIELLDKWIEKIGHTYYYEELEDDTEQKYLLSKFEKEKGAVNKAANLKLSVLTSRLTAYRIAKLHCSPDTAR